MNIEALFNSQVSRRNLLKGATASLAISTLGIETDSPQPKEFTKSRFAEQVRGFEEALGPRPLTLEQARAFIPILASLYIDSSGSNQTRRNFLSSVYILQENPNNIQKVTPEAPDAALEVKDKLYLDQHKGFVGGVILKDLTGRDIIVIDLDSANEDEESGQSYSYHQNAPYVECLPTTPTSLLRSIFIHEGFHWDDTKKDGIIDQELSTVYEDIYQRRPRRMTGFNIYLESDDYTYVTGVEELFADYSRAKLTFANDLSFTPSVYLNPVDVYNLSKIFESADLSDREILRLHRGGQYKSFLLKLGAAVATPNGIPDKAQNLAKVSHLLGILEH